MTPAADAPAHDRLFVGRPQFRDAELADIAARQGAEAAWRRGYERYGRAVASRVGGEFAAAFRLASGGAFLAVDRFSIHTLCYRIRAGRIEFSERADDLASPSRDVDPQAIYDYLYFHVIPAPRTAFRDVHRLPAGHAAHFGNGALSVAPWWTPSFDENRRAPFPALREEFRRILTESVRRRSEGNVGCFLSGGTDSSTVAGLLGEVTGKPARTFSIGFDAEGYDEMEYARIAARHFGTEHHEYYVTPADLVRTIPAIAASYDQPFGNSSVVPAYFCAKLARDSGVQTILGGDGGDELFGGNSRYAKQKVFDFYRHVPTLVRRGILEPPLGRSGTLARLPGLRKAASYIEQANTPMPDRLQMYNLLTRLGLASVLTPEFLAAVDPTEPLRRQREVYSASNANALINRMLAFDWRYTLADNDLPKVIGATSLAGIRAAFPLLDDALVDFSLRLEPRLKLKGTRLRWFFKKALRGFLPDAILRKKKHGFGLPFGVWVNTNDELKAQAANSVHALGQRGIVRKEFLHQLLGEYLPQHPGYFGEMVWILMVLEQWFARPAARRY